MAILEGGGAGPATPPKITGTSQGLTYQTLTGDHYEKLRQVVVTRFEQADNYAKSRFERFYRWEKLLHMVSKKKPFDWKANAFLPYAFSVSEQSAAMKWLALFGNRPYVTVQARKAGLDEIALRRQSLIDWHLTGDIDVQAFGGDMIRIAERYGKAIGMIAPAWEHRVMKFRAPEELPTALGPLARMSWKMAERKDYRMNAFAMDLTDFRPEPGKRRINGIGPNVMRHCFRTYVLTLDELLDLETDQMIGPSVGGQSVAEITDTQQFDMNEYKTRRMFLDKFDDIDRNNDPFDRAVELIEYQKYVPKECLDPTRAAMEEQAGLDPQKRIIIVANRKVILQDVALPWDHGMASFVEMDCVSDPYDFWGKGKIEPIEHMVYAGNEIMNMRIDNVKMAVNGMIGVHGDRMPAGWKRRLMSQPWGVLETQGPPNDVVQRFQLGDVTQSSYTEQQQLFTLIQETDAVNETMMSAPGQRDKTLGEQQMKTEMASKRLQFELVGAAQQLLGWPSGLSGFIIGLDRQYLPLTTYVNLLDPDTPDDFMSVEIGADTFAEEDQLFSYLATGATEGMNIQNKRADFVMLTQMLQPFAPVLGMMGFNFAEYIRIGLKLFGQDPGKLFMKIQGAAGAGQGGMPGGVGMPGQMPGAGVPGQAQPGGPPGMGGGFNPMQNAVGAMNESG